MMMAMFGAAVAVAGPLCEDERAALRTGAAEIANDAGTVLYRISIERE